MKRRTLLAGGAAAALLGGCKLSLEQGLFNECRPPHRHGVFADPVVVAAWEGIDPGKVWDCHVHLFGNGRSGAGVWVSPDFDRPSSIPARVRRAMFFNAGCGGEDDHRFDAGVVARLAHLAGEMPAGVKVMLLAFDFTYDEQGRRREDQSTFAVPDAYCARVARAHPDRFEWIASVHPYRRDAAAALEAAKAAGARAVKWLPSTMAIDLASPRCRPAFEAMARLDLPLLVHVGEEQAVAGAERHDFGNPLFLRHPLDHRVRVIAAHCATLGESPDLDANRDPERAPRVANVALLARLLGERRYEGLLYGDLSAVSQANRAEALPAILGNPAWKGRLLNGSDYPLPAIMPLFSVDTLVREGLLPAGTAPVLRELRHLNPLMFDFVLKRHLAWRGERFAPSAFETRTFFERRGA